MGTITVAHRKDLKMTFDKILFGKKKAYYSQSLGATQIVAG